MITTLVTTALVCFIAAITGGGVKAFGIEVPTLAPNRRVGLGILGVLLIGCVVLMGPASRLLVKSTRPSNDSPGTLPTQPSHRTDATSATVEPKPAPTPATAPKDAPPSSNEGSQKPKQKAAAPQVQTHTPTPALVTQSPVKSVTNEMCNQSASGRFYPECYRSSGKSMPVDMAFRAALRYVADFKMSATLLLGPKEYLKCDQWVEPTNGFFVNIEGSGSNLTKIKQVCFLPVGSMIQSGGTREASQQSSSASAPFNWCRPGIIVKGNDSNIITGLNANGSAVDIDVGSKNYISNVQVACDPKSSLFRGFIEEMAHNPERIEEFIAGVRSDRIQRWQGLSEDQLTQKTRAMDDLIDRIRANENNFDVEVPLLVQLNDM